MLVPLKNDSISRHLDGTRTFASTLPFPTDPGGCTILSFAAGFVIAKTMLVFENYRTSSYSFNQNVGGV